MSRPPASYSTEYPPGRCRTATAPGLPDGWQRPLPSRRRGAVGLAVARRAGCPGFSAGGARREHATAKLCSECISVRRGAEEDDKKKGEIRPPTGWTHPRVLGRLLKRTLKRRSSHWRRARPAPRRPVEGTRLRTRLKLAEGRSLGRTRAPSPLASSLSHAPLPPSLRPSRTRPFITRRNYAGVFRDTIRQERRSVRGHRRRSKTPLRAETRNRSAITAFRRRRAGTESSRARAINWDTLKNKNVTSRRGGAPPSAAEVKSGAVVERVRSETPPPAPEGLPTFILLPHVIRLYASDANMVVAHFRGCDVHERVTRTSTRTFTF
ncbi:hypothetical protein EVAR_37603_1 [Eumeta japonica]|uniref:Uncharacterized protein n=1 Tax=Eumeta variegata TaxID=151549 RepID=A0A4C1VP69_EUMVA|nr:hypothetical protein EVAR_37603_1 [Eumeta japonica]